MKLSRKILYKTLLTLLLTSTSYADCTYELFSISSTKDTRIIDFIEQLSDECEFSIIVTDPKAEEFLKTKLNKTHLRNLTIDEVLNIILTENNLYYKLQNNILKISYLQTKIFNIDYILSQRKGIGSTNVTLSSSPSTTGSGGKSSGASKGSSGGATAESGTMIESTDEVQFWKDLDKELRSVINRPHDIYQAGAPIINKNAGLVTVTATTKQMKRLESYLKKLQNKVQLQVLIDVQLLSVTMSAGKSTGIDWQQLYALQKANLSVDYISKRNVTEWTDPSIISTVGDQAKNSAHVFSLKSSASIDEVIKFLKTQGDVVSISNPKVLTLNNQPALITAGTEYFYKITSTETLAGGTSGTQSENENIQSVFAGVLLDITPEISDDKTITLKINPSLSETRTDMSVSTSSDRKMPPDLNRRQLSSVVTVKDGGRIVLGGLINTKNTVSSNKVPLLGDIPGLNYLFKYEEKTKQIEELVIIVEPHIIKKDKRDLSLSDLGYKGITAQTIQLNKNIKKANGK